MTSRIGFLALVCFLMATVPVSGQILYYSGGGSIQRIYPDGSPAGPHISGSAAGLRVVADHNRVFWSIRNDLRIQVAGADDEEATRGSGPCIHDFIDLGDTDSVDVSSIALDLNNDRIYWADGRGEGSWSLRRADLSDGSNVEDVFTGQGRPNIGGILFDPGAQKLYWGEGGGTGSASIYWATVPDGEPSVFLGGLADLPRAFELDPLEDKLYWCDATTHIYRINKDGTGNVDIPVFNARAVGMGLDYVNRLLYWADIDVIWRTNLDDGQTEMLFTSTGPDIQAFVVDFDLTPPLPKECRRFDADYDRDIDLDDYKTFQSCFTGPLP